MFPFPVHDGVSIPVSPLAAAIDALPGSISELRKHRRSPGFFRRTRLAGIKATTAHVAISFLVAALAATSATAQSSRQGTAGPEEADLRYFLECSELAKTQVLSFDEAKSCSRACLRIKLSFVPGVGLDDFDGLSPRGKAAVNVVGYRHFVEWQLQHAARGEVLVSRPLSSSVIGED